MQVMNVRAKFFQIKLCGEFVYSLTDFCVMLYECLSSVLLQRGTVSDCAVRLWRCCHLCWVSPIMGPVLNRTSPAVTLLLLNCDAAGMAV